MTNPLVTRANLLLLAGLIVIIAVVGAINWERFAAAREARDWTRHSYRVLSTIQALNLAVRQAETGQRGYLLTGDESYLEPYNAALGQVAFLEGDLQRLTADNPAEQDHLRNLAPMLQHKLEELAQTIELRRAGDLDAAMRVVRTGLGSALMQQIETALAAMTTREQGLLTERLTQGEHRGNWVRALTTLGTLLAIAGLLWAGKLLRQAWAQSARIEAEQRSLAIRLTSSLDSLSQGIAVFDAGRALTNWNAPFAALLKVPPPLMRAGTPYREIAAATAADAGAALESEAQLRYGRQDPGHPITYERTQGDGRHIELRRTGMPGGGFVLAATDMTDRVRAEEVLREAQKMQAIGQLTGGLAHDFNNLLTVILGNLEVLRGKLERDHPLHKRIDRGIWAAERGATLTRQLLAFARKQPLAPKPIDLGAVIPELVPLLRRTLGETIDVRYVDSAGLWAALADAAQVESAVLNLALNARDAMPDGGRLTIELANKVLDETYCQRHAEVAPGDYAMIAVTDTGHGMAPEVAARVFEPFFTTKQDGKGTGLGLAMVFGFVKQSGGHIKIYSEPGEGTTVRIYLPRAVGAVVATARRSTQPIDLPQGLATILVVEDEPAVREVACAILLDLGYRVIDAGDAEDGLRAFTAQPARIDLLLTDVVLPGAMRGRELADRIIAIRPDIKVLFMSGYTENSIVHGGRLDDGVQLIGKPFHREQLARKVAEVLGRAPAPMPVAATSSDAPPMEN